MDGDIYDTQRGFRRVRSTSIPVGIIGRFSKKEGEGHPQDLSIPRLGNWWRLWAGWLPLQEMCTPWKVLLSARFQIKAKNGNKSNWKIHATDQARWSRVAPHNPLLWRRRDTLWEQFAKGKAGGLQLTAFVFKNDTTPMTSNISTMNRAVACIAKGAADYRLNSAKRSACVCVWVSSD